jgi:exonuclease SbcC
MRPLKLQLRAFGSYPGSFEIDFVKLGQHGVFSITGPTGSGKTTLFDAMVYALYGELPGKREPEDVRSHFAQEGDETRVSFEFEVKGTSWTIERRPAQTRLKQRGAGVTQQLADVVLRESGKTSGGVVKAREVKVRIEGLIGLSAEQFQQVVLLPQGEFEAVLKAETKDRVELLRRLFPVQIFNDFTEHLKEVARERQQELSDVSRASEASIERIRRSFAAAAAALPASVALPWPREAFEELAFDISGYPTTMAALSEVLETVDSLTAGARDEYEGANNELQGVNRLISSFNAWVENRREALGFEAEEASDTVTALELQRLQQIGGLAPALDSFEKASSRLEASNEALARGRDYLDAHWIGSFDVEGLATAPAAGVVLQAATSRMEKLKTAVEECNEIRDLVREIEELGDELESARESLTAAEEKEETETERFNAIDKSLGEWRDQVKEFSMVNADLKLKREQITTLRAQEVIRSALDDARESRGRKEVALAKVHEKVAALRVAQREGLAGILAATLMSGEPCPTCGSLDHPKPAKTKKLVPGDDDIERADSALVSAQEAFNRIERAIATLEGQLSVNTIEASMVDLEASVSDLEGQESALKLLKEKILEFEAIQKELKESLANAKPTLQTGRAEVSARSASLKEKTSVCSRRRKKFETAFGALDEFDFDEEGFESFVNHLRDYAGDLLIRDGAAADVATSLAILNPQLSEWGVDSPRELRELIRTPDELRDIQEFLAKRRTRRDVITQANTDYESGGYPTEQLDASAVQARVAEKKETFDELFRSQTTVKVERDSILDNHRDFAASEAEIVRARNSLQEAATLYRLCSGQSAANNEIRTSLEEWVLSDYLKQVLRQANTRMEMVSSGRYALQVNSLSGDNRGRHGLDLEVFDAYTGRARKARTLSGGETFIAALALALGLADVVAAGKNRELGALFIDEGFGSLDDVSLDSVLGILDSLQDGGRIVGVISHVEELKRALPPGITVVSSEAGSRAEIHYPEF